MTTNIEDELNLPRLADALKEIEESKKEESTDREIVEKYNSRITAYNEAEKQLINAAGLDSHDEEMDVIYEQAISKYKQMIDMGFNGDPRIAGQIFEPAVSLLKISLEARASKVDKRLRVMKLNLDKERLEMQRGDDPVHVQGEEVFAGDRRALMDLIRSDKSKK